MHRYNLICRRYIITSYKYEQNTQKNNMHTYRLCMYVLMYISSQLSNVLFFYFGYWRSFASDIMTKQCVAKKYIFACDVRRMCSHCYTDDGNLISSVELFSHRTCIDCTIAHRFTRLIIIGGTRTCPPEYNARLADHWIMCVCVCERGHNMNSSHMSAVFLFI